MNQQLSASKLNAAPIQTLQMAKDVYSIGMRPCGTNKSSEGQEGAISDSLRDEWRETDPDKSVVLFFLCLRGFLLRGALSSAAFVPDARPSATCHREP